jgi:hypothetical protein
MNRHGNGIKGIRTFIKLAGKESAISHETLMARASTTLLITIVVEPGS